MASEEHLRIIQQRVDVWNKWREENPDERPDLTGAILVRAGLSAAHLREAYLSRADLRQADLTFADLSGANLSGAFLNGADLPDADLAGIEGWRAIESMKLANVYGVNDSPEGFVDWAINKGAVSAESDEEWDHLPYKDWTVSPRSSLYFELIQVD